MADRTPETGWFRTESGTILQMDFPLSDGIAQRVARGEIMRVADADGRPWVDPGAPVRPDPLAAELAQARERIATLEAALAEALEAGRAKAPAPTRTTKAAQR